MTILIKRSEPVYPSEVNRDELSRCVFSVRADMTLSPSPDHITEPLVNYLSTVNIAPLVVDNWIAGPLKVDTGGTTVRVISMGLSSKFIYSGIAEENVRIILHVASPKYRHARDIAVKMYSNLYISNREIGT